MSALTDTQKKILDIGRKEFLDKGFKDASLRGIVKEAGFTQGAFYGYYPDKASLFEALVEPAASDLVDQFQKAQKAHFDLIPQDKAKKSSDLSTEYLRQFIKYIYDNFDAFKLVVCCSEGTKYATYIHDLVDIEVAQSELYYTELNKKGKLEGHVSREFQHMIISAYFTAVFETVHHDMIREQAMEYIEELAVFFNSGWNGILKIG